jgi:hypothetical protein
MEVTRLGRTHLFGQSRPATAFALQLPSIFVTSNARVFPFCVAVDFEAQN